MANLRKLLASALTGSDLSESDIVETAVDRIASMAFTDVLGAELWRLQLAHDPSAYRRALAILSKRSRRIISSRNIRERLCDACLREWLDTKCPTCAGRGVVHRENNVRHACPSCEGSTLRRYSDTWRMRKMGFSLEAYRKWERRFAVVHERIAIADANAWRDIAQQLGWLGEGVKRDVLAFYRDMAILRGSNTLDGPAHNENSTPEYAVSSATAAD